MKCPKTDFLIEFVVGQLSEEHQTRLTEHLTQCERCSRVRNDIVNVTRRLGAAPGEFENPNLGTEVMTLIRLGRVEKELVRPPGNFFWKWMLAPVAATVLLSAVIIWWPRGSQDDSQGFYSRGGQTEKSDQWISLKVFRATPKGYKPVQGVVGTYAPLAFSYSNQAKQEFRYLMVFAVDERSEVFWYYPAHQETGKNPQSVPIEKTNRQTELPDEIQHRFSPGYLRLFAVFSLEPLDVYSVESQIRKDLAKDRSLKDFIRVNLAGTGQQSFFLAVKDVPEGEFGDESLDGAVNQP